MIFRCGICGKEWNTVMDRMMCEGRCIEKKEKYDQLRKQATLAHKKESRQKEVEDAFKLVEEYRTKAVELENKYNEDYHIINANSGDINRLFRDNLLDGLKRMADTSIKYYYGD